MAFDMRDDIKEVYFTEQQLAEKVASVLVHSDIYKHTKVNDISYGSFKDHAFF